MMTSIDCSNSWIGKMIGLEIFALAAAAMMVVMVVMAFN